MTYHERRALTLGRQIALAESNYQCTMRNSHEPCKGPLERHHIGGRDNACIYVPELQIIHCTYHHHNAQFAPHNNKPLYFSWLEFNWPEKYAMYLKLRYVRVHNRDMDMKKICEDLEKRADKALYQVA